MSYSVWQNNEVPLCCQVCQHINEEVVEYQTLYHCDNGKRILTKRPRKSCNKQEIETTIKQEILDKWYNSPEGKETGNE